jgi:hypothetical protein
MDCRVNPGNDNGRTTQRKNAIPVRRDAAGRNGV